MATTLTQNELKDKELIKLHKALLENFMKNELDWNLQRRNKVFYIYEHKVSETNIRFFICRPIKLFMVALITNQLDKIANYFPKGYSFSQELS